MWPRHISFSGNGSKVIVSLQLIINFLQNNQVNFYEKVLGHPYGKELELLGLKKVPVLKTLPVKVVLSE